MEKVLFLTLAEVIEIHNDQMQRYGGHAGIRDMNLLSSAVAMPYVSFSGKFLHADIFEMAAAYAFHISQNNPFIDGNKRIASFLFVYFLDKNKYLYREAGEKKINDNGLVALSLLIAVSSPKEKDKLVKIITNLVK